LFAAFAHKLGADVLPLLYCGGSLLVLTLSPLLASAIATLLAVVFGVVVLISAQPKGRRVNDAVDEKPKEPIADVSQVRDHGRNLPRPHQVARRDYVTSRAKPQGVERGD
jgi:hypothetical protein